MILQFLLMFLTTFFEILYWSIFVKIISSWMILFGLDFFRKIDAVVEPLTSKLFKPFRWARVGMLDLSPLVALIFLDLVRGILLNFLMRTL